MLVPPQHLFKRSEAEEVQRVKDFFVAHGWRPLRMQSGMAGNAMGGMMQIGEKGMCDWLYVRYLSRVKNTSLSAVPGSSVDLWLEAKAPGARMYCRCGPNKAGRQKTCTAHAQKNWKASEIARGALVVTVWENPQPEWATPGEIVLTGIDAMMNWYSKTFGWMHEDRLFT